MKTLINKIGKEVKRIVKNPITYLIIASALTFGSCDNSQKDSQDVTKKEIVEKKEIFDENWIAKQEDNIYLERKFKGTINQEKERFPNTGRIYKLFDGEQDVYLGIYKIDPFNVGDSVEVKAEYNFTMNQKEKTGWKNVNGKDQTITKPCFEIDNYRILKKSKDSLK